MSAFQREFTHDGERLRVACKHLSGDRYRVHVGERALEVEARALPDGRVRFWLDGQVFEAASATVGKHLQVRVAGHTWSLLPAQGRTASAGEAGGVIEAPMTGTIAMVKVAVGDVVARGDTLVVLTAMKMEHKLVAGIDGTIAELRAAVGATVDQGGLLVRIVAGE